MKQVMRLGHRIQIKKQILLRKQKWHFYQNENKLKVHINYKSTIDNINALI